MNFQNDKKKVANAFSDKYEDLVKAGVIDLTKVTRVALENAASVASMLFMTEATIVERPEKDKAPMGVPPRMAGGMVDMY